MNYRSQLLDHLARYKTDVLKITEPGVFRRGAAAVSHPHILPPDHGWLNLLEPAQSYVREYLSAHPTVTRHKDFHHLNSSQAFAFNLFFPFFMGRNETSGVLLRALGQSGIVEDWQPESIPDPSEGTNLDMVWKTSSGTKTYCEVKLSESQFGTAVADRRHKDKLETIYRPRLESCVEPSLLVEKEFFANYQLLRNLWQIAGPEHSFLIFLLPRENVTLFGQAERFRLRVIEPLRERISVIAIEDVISQIIKDPGCPENLRDFARSMRQKYVRDEE